MNRKTKRETLGFPRFMTDLPEADIQFKGVHAWISQGDSHQVVFFDIAASGEVSEHYHETPSFAGASGRLDILIKQEKIGIEVKMTRKGLRDKTLGEQLIKAIVRYQSHPDCKFLYCFVYDPEMRLSNPTGLKRDLTKKYDGFPVKVFIVPRRV